ncbi:MAG: host-nuclease inhibitor Gam family protein [Pygmaiobacter sp.]
MARKKVKSEPVLKSWGDVNNTMREIAECESCIREIELRMDRKVNDAKSEAEASALPARERAKKLEVYIKEFVVVHRDEIDGKTKQLTFGKTGFRLSTQFKVIVKAEDAIARVKALKLFDFIKISETLNKDALRKHSAQEIAAAGCTLKCIDEFWYEINQEALRNCE